MTLKRLEDILWAKHNDCLKHELDSELDEQLLDAIYWDGYNRGIKYAQSQLELFRDTAQKLLNKLYIDKSEIDNHKKLNLDCEDIINDLENLLNGDN